jgi:hypothetical protein
MCTQALGRERQERWEEAWRLRNEVKAKDVELARHSGLTVLVLERN